MSQGFEAGLNARVRLDAETSRHARRLFVGNLPIGVDEKQVREWFRRIMVEWGGIIDPGDPIMTHLYVPEKRCMLLEFRTVEETEAASTLDFMEYEGKCLRIHRPADYADREVPLPKRLVVPRINHMKVGLASPFVDDELTKIFIGGLPKDLKDQQLKDMLGIFGTLKAFYLAKDPEELGSLGYGFCEFVSNESAERCTMALNGVVMRGKTLLVRKVINPSYEQELIDTSSGIFHGEGPDFSLITQYPGGSMQPNFDTMMYKNRPITVAEFIRAKQDIEILQQRAKEMAQDRALKEAELFASGVGPPGLDHDHRTYEELPGLCGMPGITANLFPSLNYLVHPEGATNVVSVEGMVEPERCLMRSEFGAMFEDIMREVAKHGTVNSLVVPRENEGFSGSCIGKVYVEYMDVSSAVRACNLLSHRNWKGRPIKTKFFQLAKFMRNELD
jgi:U2 snRNP auxiliary factor large subunit